jgi:hypothetical protein
MKKFSKWTEYKSLYSNMLNRMLMFICQEIHYKHGNGIDQCEY